jgi:pyruvate,water dikinase
VGTGKATEVLTDNQIVTVSCAQGDEGYVYEGALKFTKQRIDPKTFQHTKTKIMVNLGNPNEAFKTSLLPVSGVGLTRIEFIINDLIKIHPMALVNFESLKDSQVKEAILKIIGNYSHNPQQFFIDKLAEGIGTIAGAFYPRPVIVRFSDFKTNEYANLLGGKDFEPTEENPMLGFRGASRYYHETYRKGFALECLAIKFVREMMGLTNVKVMIPFCRTTKEAKLVLDEMAKNGLIRGENQLEVYVMAELPSNILNAQAFSHYVDGFSIGSNDLTQMVLGIDRDSSILGELFDERDPAVMQMIAMAIEEAKASHLPIGICGQAPSDYPEITTFLVENGIDSISVTSDVVFKTIEIVAEAEEREHFRIGLIHETEEDPNRSLLL